MLRLAGAWLSTPAGLTTLFVVGFGIRLVLARGGGFPFDIGAFQAWSGRLAERGPWRFYPGPGEQFFVDYPPGFLYVLWFIGLVSRAFGSATPNVFLVKLPSIVADVGLAWLVMRATERLTPPATARRIPVKGFAAAAILLNPAVIFLSAVWGQADSVLAVIVVASFLLLGTGEVTFRREAAGMALLAVAVATKPQGVFVLPIVVLVLVWRHVRARDGDATRSATSGLARVAVLGAASLGAWLVVLAPFRLGPISALRFYTSASSTYRVTSVFAFNLWALVGFWRPDVGANAVRYFGLPAFGWGLALFAVGAAVVCALAWRSLRSDVPQGRVLAFGAAAMTCLSFALLTRIHERYLFLSMALLAIFVGSVWLRRAFALVSALYLINIYFPYVYYLRFVKRPAPTFGGFFDAVYGGTYGDRNIRFISAITTVVCVVVALRGWRGLKAPPSDAGEPLPRDEATAAEEAAPAPARSPGERWALRLHAITRRQALAAIAIFAVALAMRVAGLGHPPGMYFDEVYHARTGAEYLAHKEVYEWTHPPFAKELIGLSIATLSNFGERSASALPPGATVHDIAGGRQRLAWAHASGDQALLLSGDARSCSLRAREQPILLDVRPLAVAVTDAYTYVAGVGPEGPVLLRVEGSVERWRATLPAEPAEVASLGDETYVVTTEGQLVAVSSQGEAKTVAVGASSVSAPVSNAAWVSFPKEGKIASWDATGARKAVIDMAGVSGPIVAVDGTSRVLAATSDHIAVVDTETNSALNQVSGSADALGAVPETGVAWAAEGRRLRAIEVRGGSVIGHVDLKRAPSALVGDPIRHQLLALSPGHLECASARPQFAWRFGSAVMGAAMVALVWLLALRLFGNAWAAGAAALFLAVEGLAFSMSRLAMNDSYATAFILAAWFCALSALHRWGRSKGDLEPSRSAMIGWLLATGVMAGLGLASKWVAVYSIAAIGLLFLWDGLSRPLEGIFSLTRRVIPTLALLALLLGVIPLVLYALSYIPYFSLGHNATGFLKLQRDMYNYHAHLVATHPFSSPMYGWPFGYRAVFLYLNGSGAERSEIWTYPNLVVLWAGLVAMGAAALRVVRERSAVLAIVVFGALAQYLPWAPVRRVVFLYHYLPVVPFLAIALGWFLVIGLRGYRYRRVVAIGVVVGAVAFFLALLPMLEGWSVSTRYLDSVRNIFPWVIK